MSERHRIGPDGIREDGVATYPIDARDRQLLDDAVAQLSQQRMPLLLRSGNPDDRMFVAAFDGTGNDADRDPLHRTNIGLVRDRIVEANDRQQNGLQVGYVAGPGTQSRLLPRLIDGATGHTYEANLEDMYGQLIRQAKEWVRENPDATISIASIGFSRGAEQAAGFTRLVHERGIADPDSRVVTKDARGNTVVTYTRTLVPPARTAQVAVLLDPVPTGEPAGHDRRLPPSVIAAVQFTSEDERRNLFRASRHIDFGTTADGRFTNVWLPGAHGDLGGGYHRNGLSIRAGNLLADVLNATSDRPFLVRQPEVDDPRLDVVHRSERGMLLYRIMQKADRRGAGGLRDDLGGNRCRLACDRAEPADAALSSRFAWQPVAAGGEAARVQADDRMAAARREVDALFERVGTAALAGDEAALRAAGRDYLRSADGLRLQHDGARLAETLLRAPAQPQPAQDVTAEPPVHRHAAPALQR